LQQPLRRNAFPLQSEQTMTTASLESRIEESFAAGDAAIGDDTAQDAFVELRCALEAGKLRAAEPDADAPTGWRVNAWVKRGILLGFRIGKLTDQSVVGNLTGWHAPQMTFIDKSTYPARIFTAEDGVRIVPGGSSVRTGAYVARGVVMMPPAYINVGAYVDEGTMVDSHALVGSCAQIGRRVHLSAGAQIGGVLEPVNASPVIIEDDVLVGGNTGVYEGTIVRRGAVLAAGTILTRGTPVYDVVHRTILKATPATPLIIPEGAVVVPGARAVTAGYGKQMGLSVYTPVIVKYRDEKTDLSTTLEELLR
jgi:2,3,4,5-tetrahydropyridine-2-carboxylate N-succinyltransferase